MAAAGPSSAGSSAEMASWAAKRDALLAELEEPPPVVGSEEERMKREKVVEGAHLALITLYRSEATSLMTQGQHGEAVTSARQALKFSLKVHGEGALEIVPAYLLLAEATLGTGKYHQVQELLSMANWTVVRAGGRVGHSVRSAMHRTFGKLYAAQGKLGEALTELARDVYHSALQVGPDHIDTTNGYFHMGAVLGAGGQAGPSLAMYDKVVDVWYKFLSAAREGGEAPSALLPAQIGEARSMLGGVAAARAAALGPGHVAVGEAQYTAALLEAWVGDASAAAALGGAALEVYRGALGEDHPSTADVAALVGEVGA